MKLLPTFFDTYFTVRDKVTDTNKDADGKGTLERYNEVIANDIDENLMPYIDNLLPNTINPMTAFEQLIPYLENARGYDDKNGTLRLSSAMNFRRAVLRYIHKYYNLKGTIRNFEVLFGMIGLGVTVTEVLDGTGFDSSITLDDAVRTFDSACPACTDFSLALTGDYPTLTESLIRGIISIIVFNTPINAILRTITYNGETVVEVTGDYNTDFSIDDFNVLT